MAELKTRIVLRNDSTGAWEEVKDNINYKLLKGEVGIEFTASGKPKMKIGDGTHTWADLPYFGGEEAHVYQAEIAYGTVDAAAVRTAIMTAVNGAELNAHDVAVVKQPIVNPTTIANAAKESPVRTIAQQYQHTAYRWDPTIEYDTGKKDANGKPITTLGDWVAFDGNYSASSVYFDDDFTFTKSVGTVTVSTGSNKKVAAAGKNLKEFFSTLFATEINPVKGNVPTLSWSTHPQGTVEVGTQITPSYAVTFNKGTYKLDGQAKDHITSATGYTIDIADLTDANKTTSSGSFSKFTATDGMSGYAKITASATYADGNVPKTNLGNDYDADFKKGVRQKGGTTASITSNGYSSYRAWFYGYTNNRNLDPTALTSANIRPLITTKDLASNTGLKSVNGAFPGTFTTGKYQQMFFLVPKNANGTSRKTVTSVKNNSNDSPAGTVKGPVTVYVKGAGDYALPAGNAGLTTVNTVNGWAYDLYYIDLENAAAGATWKIATK
jgi:hypothetical protein